MEVIPAIRTAAQALRADFAKFLQTNAGRRARQAALRAAGWRCERCGTRGRIVVPGTGWDAAHPQAAVCVRCADCAHHGPAVIDHARVRLMVRVVRQLQHAEDFHTLADLVDALKYRLARLRITWTPDDITAACASVDIREAMPYQKRGLVELEPGHSISRADATAILATLPRQAIIHVLP